MRRQIVMNPRNFEEDTDNGQSAPRVRRVGRRLPPPSLKPPAFPLFASLPDSNRPRAHLQVPPHEFRRHRHLFKSSVNKNRR
jgi:hypothetical protein